MGAGGCTRALLLAFLAASALKHGSCLDDEVPATDACEESDVECGQEVSLLQSSFHVQRSRASSEPPVTDKEMDAAMYWISHEPTLPGCGVSTPADAVQPVVQVMAAMAANTAARNETPPSALCYFNYATSCAVAHTEQDFSEFSGTWPSGVAAVEGATHNPDGFKDGAIETKPRVFEFDAEFCTKAGWLGIPRQEQERLLKNYTALQARAQQTCAAHSELGANLSMKDFEAIVDSSEKDHYRTAIENSRNRTTFGTGFLSPANFEKILAFNCVMGAADCFLHWCLYNFCILSDGRVGMAHECREDWHFKELPSNRSYP